MRNHDEFAERTVFMKFNQKLRTNSAGGPDMPSPSFLNKVRGGFIASPLTFLFEEWVFLETLSFHRFGSQHLLDQYSVGVVTHRLSITTVDPYR